MRTPCECGVSLWVQDLAPCAPHPIQGENRGRMSDLLVDTLHERAVLVGGCRTALATPTLSEALSVLPETKA